MKIDKSKHKHTWRVQKGCRIEWFVGSKKGSGVVTRVVSSNGPWDTASEVKVLGDATKSEITMSVDKVRIVKTQSTLKKDQR